MDDVVLKKTIPVMPVTGMEYFGHEAHVRFKSLMHATPNWNVGETKKALDSGDEMVVQIKLDSWTHMMGARIYRIHYQDSDGKYAFKNIQRLEGGTWDTLKDAELESLQYLRVINMPPSGQVYPCALPGGKVLPSEQWLREHIDEALEQSSVPLVGSLAVIASQMGYSIDPTSLLLSHGLGPTFADEDEFAVSGIR